MLHQMRNWSLALIMLSASSEAFSANNDFFHFRVSRFPFVAGKCTASAQDLGRRFAEVTGTRVASVKCQDTTRFGADIEVIYVSEKPLQFISTYNPDSANPQGSFKTIDDCRAGKDAKVELFRRATGLEPIASYCMHERADNASNFPFVLNIVAAGEPAKYYRQLSLPLSYGPADPDGFLSQVRTHLLNRPGLDLSHAELTRDQFGSMHLIVGYYAEFVFRMQEIRQIIFTDATACQLETPHLEAGLAAYGASLVASTCQFDLYDAIMLRSFYTPGPRLMLEDAHREFATYESCASERQNVLDFLRSELKWDVSAVICVKSDSIHALAVRRIPE